MEMLRVLNTIHRSRTGSQSVVLKTDQITQLKNGLPHTEEIGKMMEQATRPEELEQCFDSLDSARHHGIGKVESNKEFRSKVKRLHLYLLLCLTIKLDL